MSLQEILDAASAEKVAAVETLLANEKILLDAIGKLPDGMTIEERELKIGYHINFKIRYANTVMTIIVMTAVFVVDGHNFALANVEGAVQAIADILLNQYTPALPPPL